MISAASVRLGAIERHVRVAQQLIGHFAVGRRHRDPDAGADDHLMAEHIERIDQGLDNLAGKLARAAGRGVTLHDGELVAAEPRHGIAGGHDALQPFRDRTQKRVADGMTQ